MIKHNNDIRTKARENGVYLYEIAEKMNVSEPTFARMLRNVLCFHVCANAVTPTPSSWHTPPGYHASGTLLRQ